MTGFVALGVREMCFECHGFRRSRRRSSGGIEIPLGELPTYNKRGGKTLLNICKF